MPPNRYRFSLILKIPTDFFEETDKFKINMELQEIQNVQNHLEKKKKMISKLMEKQ